MMPWLWSVDRDGREERIDRVAIWIPLAVGTGALATTIFIHALAVAATVNLVRREVRVGRAGTGFWTDVAIVVAAISFALGAHWLEIAVWAVLFMVCGEFPSLAWPATTRPSTTRRWVTETSS